MLLYGLFVYTYAEISMKSTIMDKINIDSMMNQSEVWYEIKAKGMSQCFAYEMDIVRLLFDYFDWNDTIGIANFCKER